MSEQYKYDLRGVSATKDEVHAAIKNLDKGLYPLAFCKVMPDITGGDADYCNLMHADTAGTKTSLAYLYWKETGDVSVWKGIAQDAIVMNLDDMACVGCTKDILLSSTIGRNKRLITGEVISTIINAANDFLEMLGNHGVGVHLAGGETADVGDIVRTIDVGYTAFARMKQSNLVVNDIKDGDVIVGFSSSGQSTYETNYNGGTGSNGLTSARHDVLNSVYGEKYPESFDTKMPKEVAYIGSKMLTDPVDIEGVGSLNVGQLILSPTRTYLPVIKKILAALQPHINGMIHCTGGGQTKVNKFIKDKHIIKDNLLTTPYLFQLIQSESGTSWKEMYQVFNMGHRLEVYLPEAYAQELIDIASSFNIDAQVIGRVEDFEGEKVTIVSEYGRFEY
ncbi:MAG: phosphoribosylformylglycinamidine cyclo-ligase [Saprospiraceae bacterium]|jgi:phosphoribosylformylglycinamidine cyclo-ligase